MTVTLHCTTSWQLESGLMQECFNCRRKAMSLSMRMVVNIAEKDEPIRSNMLLCGECATKACLMNQGLGS